MNSANYRIIPPSRLVLDLNEDHQSHELFLMSPPKSEVSSSSSFPLSSPIPACYNLLGQDHQEGSCKYENHRQLEKLQHPQEVDPKPLFQGEFHGGHGPNITLWKKGGGGGAVRDERDQADRYYSVKWMSSKMRIMKKMMSSDHHEQSRDNTPMITSGSISDGGDHKLFVEGHKQLPSSSSLETDSSSNSSSYNTNPIRVCSDCNTTKTPLWRSGPRGPKSLCNACGIRQRKARRAMAAAAAAAAGSGALAPATTPSPKSNSKQHKNERLSRAAGCRQEPIKMKRKAKPRNNHASTGGRKLCLEEFAIRLSKHLAFQRVFPQEEKEAAILLMALSYGLVHG